MHSAPQHLSTIELEQGLPEVLASPRDAGRLEAIVVRPASNERQRLESTRLTPEGGVEGDRWVTENDRHSPDGRPDPRCQVSLMNARFLRQVAGEEEARCLAGDNLIIDLDMSEANLPAGSQLAIGDSVVVEISEVPHTGCSSFARRYGDEARQFMNNQRGKSLHLRGRYARVVSPGTIAVGDLVRKIDAAHAASSQT